MAFRRDRWLPGVPSLDGRGEDETINCASTGLVGPDGLIFDPGSENRSQSSSAGSARGVFRPWGGCLVDVDAAAGDETGDELLARFRPLRGSMGDMAVVVAKSFRHKILSLCDKPSSVFGAS